MDLQIQHSREKQEDLPSTDNPFLEENKTFIDALSSGSTANIRSSYSDAIETLKVSLAADLSLKEKRPVTINEL